MQEIFEMLYVFQGRLARSFRMCYSDIIRNIFFYLLPMGIKKSISLKDSESN